ncbi:unnamed protein product [Owenia fusiformis]|uniref:DDB1- and CUL4-associated factor 12 beta-propeller domain-containing protein n=1 Tax=Owenia fusiformis TaxID=6347 RepID=A0A8J1TV93_OWEFU|nr:unnamed protein product [Owenia fusiformis]
MHQYQHRTQNKDQNGSGCKRACLPHTFTSRNVTTDIFKYTQGRQLGAFRGDLIKLTGNYVAAQIPGLLQEQAFQLGRINKIFASQWLSERKVVIGSKCNQIAVLDLFTKQMAMIPSLKSTDSSQPADCPCGIHAVELNPSKTLMATGGVNTNDLAIYQLPTCDPVCIGEQGHQDWVFDIKWLDDQFVVTGSRDGNLALWHIPDTLEDNVSRMQSLQVPEYSVINPTLRRFCKKAEKVRALAYNDNSGHIAALSLNAYVHQYDTRTFKQICCKKLHHTRENVCMSVHKDRGLYAVGSQSYVALLDSNTLKHVHSILSKQRGCGIRSVSFRNDVVTIGTGQGAVLFYDLRMGKYLECDCGHPCQLTAGKGWLAHDDNYRDYFYDQEYPNAIYTHCYNETGTQLFTAGGPLPAGLWGNYAAVWA